MSTNPNPSVLGQVYALAARHNFLVPGLGTKSPSGNTKIVGYRCPVCSALMERTETGAVRSRCPNGHQKRQVYATYHPVGLTCPKTCALLFASETSEEPDGPCYALLGNVNRHQRRAGESQYDPFEYLTRLPTGAYVRLAVSGDHVGPSGEAYRLAVRLALVVRPDLKAWTYSHAWRDVAVAAWRATLPKNVSVVASLDDPTEEEVARKLGWEVVASVTETEDGETFTDEEARRERALGRFPCPAQRRDGTVTVLKNGQRRNNTIAFGCVDGLCCSRPGRHVVFAAHGPRAKAAVSALAARRLPIVG